MKKVTKLLLLLLALLPTIAQAHDFVANGIYYNINGNEATVTYQGTSATGVSNEYQGTIVIPSTVNYNGVTYPVTAIADSAFYQNYYLDGATIGDNVRTIGKYAFAGNGFTKNITIGNAVTTIGDNAFYNCYSLSDITIPNSVVTIGSGAFYNCYKAANINIGNSVTSIGYNAFYNCKKATSLDIPNSVTSIGNFAFNECAGLTEVTIGTGVTDIGDLAFYKCSSLETLNYNAIACNDFNTIGGAFAGTPISTLNIGNSVQRLPSDFVRDLKNLTRVDIPNSVITIGKEAFYGCSGLTQVTFGNSVQTIGVHAFYNCTGLTSVDIPNSVATIDHRAFNGCTGLTHVTIGTGVTSIGTAAFNDCPSLASVNYNAITCRDITSCPFDKNLSTFIIGDEVQVIPERAAEGLTNLTSLTIPNSVTKIDLCAFGGCTGVTDLTLGNSIDTIGVGAFYDCIGLTRLELPNSVTTLEFGAFEGCTGLKYVSFGSSMMFCEGFTFNNALSIDTVICTAVTPPRWLSSDVFMDSIYESTPLFVPEGSVSDYENDRHGWGQFAKIRPIGYVDVLATSISLYFTNLRLRVGQKISNHATVLPENTEDKRVNWSSSDPTVASVDSNGMITALKVGVAYITATTVDGSNLSATGTVTVITSPGDVSGDGVINIKDVTSLINLLLSNGDAPAAADVNGDGTINIKDVTDLINTLLAANS